MVFSFQVSRRITNSKISKKSDKLLDRCKIQAFPAVCVVAMFAQAQSIIADMNRAKGCFVEMGGLGRL